MGVRNKKTYFISIIMVFFWTICLLEVVYIREDYPFSFFGMYHMGVWSSAPFDKVKLEVLVNDKPLERQYNDPYFLMDKLRDRLLKDSVQVLEIDSKPDSVITYYLETEKYDELRQFVLRQIIKPVKSMVKVGDQVRVRLTYQQWRRLSYKSHKTPDFEKIVFNEVFEP